VAELSDELVVLLEGSKVGGKVDLGLHRLAVGFTTCMPVACRNFSSVTGSVVT
jgi:hypothetical protein